MVIVIDLNKCFIIRSYRRTVKNILLTGIEIINEYNNFTELVLGGIVHILGRLISPVSTPRSA